MSSPLTLRSLAALGLFLVVLSCGRSPAMAVATAPAAPSDSTPLTSTTDRRLIRTAELTLEASSPAAERARLSAVAQSRGGFVVSSELSRHQEDGDDDVVAQVVLRVPSAAFAATLEELRGAGVRVVDERERGEDVTEEYVDLEARLRASRALEAQLLSFLRETHSVKDALEVHERVAAVRVELEKAEGRRRFLEDQAALSTITVRVVTTPPIVARGRFDVGAAVRLALRDGVAVASGLVTGGIRLLGLLVPVVLLLGAPLWVALRLVRRRSTRTVA